jgi:hypothetical protein
VPEEEEEEEEVHEMHDEEEAEAEQAEAEMHEEEVPSQAARPLGHPTSVLDRLRSRSPSLSSRPARTPMRLGADTVRI